MKNFYIYFPQKENEMESTLKSAVLCSDFWKEIEMSIIRIDCEENTTAFYNKKNKEAFIDEFEALGDLLQIGNFEKDEILNILISENNIRQIRYNPKVTYKQWILENQNICDAQEFMKEMAEKKFEHNDQEFYILHFWIGSVSSYVNIIRDDNSNNPQIFSFKSIKGFELDSLICEKNKTRKLNRNDFRHCENHPDYRSRKSPLIGGIAGFDNAEELLYGAIGDFRTSKNILINLDPKNNDHIIRFEDENFNNQYHAYHIVKNEKGNYIKDQEKMLILKSHDKGIKRAFELLKYRSFFEMPKM